MSTSEYVKGHHLKNTFMDNGHIYILEPVEGAQH